MHIVGSQLEHLGFSQFRRPHEISARWMRAHAMRFSQASGGGHLPDGRSVSIDWSAAIDDLGNLWARRNGTDVEIVDLCIELLVHNFIEEPLLIYPTEEMLRQLGTIHPSYR